MKPQERRLLPWKQVILYDDKVEIYYNCIDKKGPDDLEHQAFCVYRQDCEVDPKELGLRHNVMGCKLALEMYFWWENEDFVWDFLKNNRKDNP